VAKRCNHRTISTTVLKRHAIKGQQQFSESHWQLSPECIKQKIKAAYNNYFPIKAQWDAWDTWIGQLIVAQASTNDTTVKNCGNN